jgi:competence protein ComEA
MNFLPAVKQNSLLLILLSFVMGLIITFVVLNRRLGAGGSSVTKIKAGSDGTVYEAEQSTMSVAQTPDKPAGSVVVDLSGAIEKPGIYTLSADARIGDLIRLGGGIRDDASLLWVSKNLNLSQKLSDSQKIYVPFEWETYTPEENDILALKEEKSKTGSTNNNNNQNDDSQTDDDNSTNIDKTNVNNASLTDLDALTGIGPVYAQRIIDKRPYDDFADFKARCGIPASTVDKIKDSLSF